MNDKTMIFGSALARDLFQMGAENMQAQLAEAYESIDTRPTPEDLSRMSGIEDEKRSEGRTLRPFRQNPHE